jgi:hypothetical protein
MRTLLPPPTCVMQRLVAAVILAFMGPYGAKSNGLGCNLLQRLQSSQQLQAAADWLHQACRVALQHAAANAIDTDGTAMSLPLQQHMIASHIGSHEPHTGPTSRACLWARTQTNKLATLAGHPSHAAIAQPCGRTITVTIVGMAGRFVLMGQRVLLVGTFAAVGLQYAATAQQHGAN